MCYINTPILLHSMLIVFNFYFISMKFTERKLLSIKTIESILEHSDYLQYRDSMTIIPKECRIDF